MIKNCGTCAGYAPDQEICRLNGSQGWKSTDSCNHWLDHLEKCDACGREFLPTNFIWVPEHNALLCSNCCQNLNTCTTCIHNSCPIESDNSGIPKMVQQTIQQGNMTFMTQVINPELTQKYCPTCECADAQGKCTRGSTCTNYKSVLA